MILNTYRTVYTLVHIGLLNVAIIFFLCFELEEVTENNVSPYRYFISLRIK